MTDKPQTFVISGGTGSFGSSLARYLLEHTEHKVRILDRSEAKIERMMAVHPPGPRLTFIIGDIRDRERLVTAFYRADIIVHAAALKVVSLGEVHANEFFKTNIVGTFNCIEAAIANHATVKQFMFISSDKACNPLNGYGVSKRAGEWLVRAANLHGHGVHFSSVRGGNVWASRGSVVEKWIISDDTIKVYNPDVTRFHLKMQSWLKFALDAITHSHGGETFIPKCDAWNLMDLANAFQTVVKDKSILVAPPRYGDKTHEVLISEEESRSSIDLGWAYVIEPSEDVRRVWNYVPHEGQPVNGAVSSDKVRRMVVDELRTLISKTI